MGDDFMMKKQTTVVMMIGLAGLIVSFQNCGRPMQFDGSEMNGAAGKGDGVISPNDPAMQPGQPSADQPGTPSSPTVPTADMPSAGSQDQASNPQIPQN